MWLRCDRFLFCVSSTEKWNFWFLTFSMLTKLAEKKTIIYSSNMPIKLFGRIFIRFGIINNIMVWRCFLYSCDCITPGIRFAFWAPGSLICSHLCYRPTLVRPHPVHLFFSAIGSDYPESPWVFSFLPFCLLGIKFISLPIASSFSPRDMTVL